MKETPFWALTFFYWLHMLGTVLWIGGLITVNWLVGPSARQLLDPAIFDRLMDKIHIRLENLGWFSLILLAGTGMIQMSSNQNYDGFLAITNRWAVAILVKHLAYGAIILLSAYLTWGLNPALHRAALVQSKTTDPIQQATAGLSLKKMRARESQLLRLNLFLGIIILGLTALARAS